MSGNKNGFSIKDIAKMCDVSVATVSRVINNNGRFSDDTRDRVLKVINDYNYQPNAIARGLRTNKTRIIAIIVPDITNEFFSTIASVVQDKAFLEGYACSTFNTNESKETEEKCLEAIKTMNVSGIISINGHFDLSANISRDIPIVYIDRNPDDIKNKENCVFISSNHEQGGYLAGHTLTSLGSRKPMCITALRGAVATISRTNGFKKGCEKNGVKVDENNIIFPKEASEEEAYKIVKRIIEKQKEFDAIFCETDWLAVGAIKALVENRIDIPNKVQVIGFDDIRATNIGMLPITTIHQPKEEIGRLAILNLFQLINKEDVTEKNIVLSVELVKRSTTLAQK